MLKHSINRKPYQNKEHSERLQSNWHRSPREISDLVQF